MTLRRAAALAASLAALAIALWRLTPPPDPPTAPPGVPDLEARRREELLALGYAEGAADATPGAADGVTRFDRERAMPGTNVWCSVRSDEVHFMDMDGRVLRNLLALERDGGEEAMRRASVVGDVFHPNGIVVLGRDVGPARAGNGLLCLRELDRLAIVDPGARRVVWSWGLGELDGPHHPTLLPDGAILVFDNGTRRGWSRLLEVDPLDSRIRWQWRAEPPDAFHSRVRGSVLPLANGNLLVTESTRGRAFELARDGRVVWEFHNPERTADGTTRRQIYRMIRIPPAS